MKQKTKVKNNKGITLIVLVITVIVLIILGGVSIAMILNDNGIITKSNYGKEEYTKTALQEELEMKIAAIRMEKAQKREKITIEDIAKLLDIGALIADISDFPIVGEYKDYDFMIDENFAVTIGGKLTGAKPEITLTKDTDEIVEELIIKVKAFTTDGTIVSIKKPDGTVTTETEFEYKVNENKTYKFIVEGSNGRRSVMSIQITNVKETAIEPIIVSNFGCPVVTLKGVKIDGTTTITYDTKEGFENYYSLDNGTTWNKYTGPFEIKEETTIMAKTEKNGTILSESSKTITLEKDVASTALYDENIGTSISFNGSSIKKYYMKVSPEMQGEKISILMSMGSYTTYGIICYDANDKELSSQFKKGQASQTEFEFTIDEGTTKIALYYDSTNNGDWGNMIELYVMYTKETAMEPVIQSYYGCPVLKSTGVELDPTLTITYDTKEGLENYYSLDKGATWNEYTGPFELEEDTTIMAKTLKDGYLLSKSKKTISAEKNAAPGAVYDEDFTTSISFSSSATKKYYIYVSPEMQGKQITIRMSMGSYTTHGIICYGENDKELSSQLEKGKASRKGF